MQNNVFLKLDGVLGGSEEPRHRGEIEVSSFSWGGVGGGMGSAGSGGGAGKFHATNMMINARADKASPFLMVYSAEGRYFQRAVLTVEEVSGSGNWIRTNTITMTDVLIGKAASNGGTVDDSDGVISFVLDFANYVMGRG